MARAAPVASLAVHSGGVGAGSREKLEPSLTVVNDLDRDRVAAAYGRGAPIYDVVFGPVLSQGRRAAVAAAERIGGRILEVGVGTGLSLGHYARSSRIVGVDISRPMLQK